MRRHEARAPAEIGHELFLADRALTDRVGEGEVGAVPARRGQAVPQVVAGTEMRVAQVRA